MTDPRVDRRSFLRATLLGATSVAAGALLAACSTAAPRQPDAAPDARPTTAGSTVTGRTVLLAYFSRAGENYYYGGRRRLAVGHPMEPGRLDVVGWRS